jgi:type I pantothenate kinase
MSPDAHLDARFIDFEHDGWAKLRANTPMTLDESDLARLRGINEELSLDEVAQIYLPLCRLLNLYVAASQQLYKVTDTFLGQPAERVPYVIGVAGSVAVGKSTVARVLQALLARWPDHPKVDLVTTDGFLHPNAVLEERGLMDRKGFPESYDVRRLVRFMASVKAGDRNVRAPVYSHLAYDVLHGEERVTDRPDILIVEGLNVLQTGDGGASKAKVFVSDFFDFSIYMDAGEDHIVQWYLDRFLTLRDTIFQDPESYFHRYSDLSEEEAIETARDIWTRINGPNLRENILPTRERAHLIIEKDADHTIKRVRLRRI